MHDQAPPSPAPSRPVVRYGHGQPASTQDKPGHCRAKRGTQVCPPPSLQNIPGSSVDNAQRCPPPSPATNFLKILLLDIQTARQPKQPPYAPRLGRSRTAGAAPPRPPGLAAPCGLPATGPPPWPTSTEGKAKPPTPKRPPARFKSPAQTYPYPSHPKRARARHHRAR